MNNDKLTKKLAIFYHPLFQNLVNRWINSFDLNSENINMITFIEINIRIQKAMINEFDFNNSLSSALTDWLRELENLSDKPNKNNIKKNPTKKEKEPLTSLSEQLNQLSFEATTSNDKYLNYFKIHRNHQALKFASTLLSIEGFGKFLFDLCSSWCEDLDIELFAFFLLGLFTCLTFINKDTSKIVINKIDYIPALPAGFHTYMKLLKNHFNRYKKVDLSNYQSWYEWNYMPFRIQEIQNKLRDTFNTIFENDSKTIALFDEIFIESIHEIESKRLYEPTTAHFGAIINMEDRGIHDKSTISQIFQDEASSLQIKFDASLSNQKHTKVYKKISMPIIGKQIPKQEAEEESKVMTIKSVNMFIDQDEEQTSNSNNSPQNNNNGLYPIWEKEISDMVSEPSSRKSSNKKSRLIMQAQQGSPHDSSRLSFSPQNSVKIPSHRYNNSFSYSKGGPSNEVSFTKSNKNRILDLDEGYVKSNQKNFIQLINTTDPDQPQPSEKNAYKIFNIANDEYGSKKLPIVTNAIPKKSEKKNNILANTNLYEDNMGYDHLEQKTYGYYQDSVRNSQKSIKSRSKSSMERSHIRPKSSNRFLDHPDLAVIGKGGYTQESSLGMEDDSQNMTHNNTFTGMKTNEFFDISSKPSRPTISNYNPYSQMSKNKFRSVKSKIDMQHKFDFSEYENLFPEGLQGMGIEKVTNYPDYYKKIEEIKEKYNAQYQSEFLRYENIDEKGARHDMGGAITVEEKNSFYEKLQKRLNIHQKKIDRRVKKAQETGKRVRNIKTYDAEKRPRVFLNPQNRILFKELVGILPKEKKQ